MDANDDSDHEDEDIDGDSSRTLTIVKCGLRRAMALDDASYLKFSKEVDVYVTTTSFMLHRAGLSLLHHLLRQAQAGARIPDLFQQPSTYWKNWLRLDAGRGFVPDAESAKTWADVEAYLGAVEDVEADATALDQVVAYAATTFKTVVCNNAWVPLIPRLTRLTKATVQNNTSDNPGKLSAYDILLQARSKQPDYTGWPSWARDFVLEVRTRLMLPAGTYLHDEYGKSLVFHDIFMFNRWMLERLRELGAKGIKLSPTFRVRRAFVRLDRKVLLRIAQKACPDHPAIEALALIKSDHTARVKANDGTAFFNPDKGDHALLPKAPKIGRKKDSADPDTWAQDRDSKLEAHANEVAKIRATDEYKRRKAAYTIYYRAQTKATTALFARITTKKGWRFNGSVVTDGVAVCLQFSKPKPVDPDDKGVEKKKVAPRRGKVAPAVEGYNTALSTLIVRDEPGCSNLHLAQGTTLVVGNDPGRVKIASMAYVLDERTNALYPEAPRQGSWSLSRSQFYQESGTRRQDRAQAARFEELKAAWQALGGGVQDDEDAADDDVDTTGGKAGALGGEFGALRTLDPVEVEVYMQRYTVIKKRWWELALQRRESRASFQRYSGKRKVLDRFFGSVRRKLASLFPGAALQVAYGQAYQSMKPSGKGEIAVPTTGAYKSCGRMFGIENVVPTDEFRSTAVDWESGLRKQAVFRRVTGTRDSSGTWRFDTRFVGHVKGKIMPDADESDVEAVRAFAALQVARNKARRSGKDLVASNAGQASGARILAVAAADNKELKNGGARYPEVRGLRFSTKTRSYLDRDLSAAVTIARLRVLELTGRPRPAPFTRGVKLA